MKILICFNNDIYCNIALNLLLKELKNHEVALYHSSSIGKRPNFQNLAELLFYEKDFFINQYFPYLKKAPIKQNKFLTLNQISHFLQAPILKFENINKDGLSYIKRNWLPDLII